MDDMTYIHPHRFSGDSQVTNFGKKMFALKPVWTVYRESNFGIDGNIDFSNFRFSYIKINPENCDDPIITAYPAYHLKNTRYKDCFDF